MPGITALTALSRLKDLKMEMSSKADEPRAYSVYADDPLYIALVKERDELRAEVERLTKQNLNLFDERDWLEGTAEQQAKDIERLRHAITAAIEWVDLGNDPEAAIKELRRIAQSW